MSDTQEHAPRKTPAQVSKIIRLTLAINAECAKSAQTRADEVEKQDRLEKLERLLEAEQKPRSQRARGSRGSGKQNGPTQGPTQ
jgi:hypothetical protein